MVAERVALAAVAGAHGVRGEVRLKLFAAGIDSLERHPQLLVGGRAMKLEALRDGGKAVIARFAGIADRAAAQALRGELVEVERAALPPLEPGEYYHADLLGLACVDRSGAPLGRVVAVDNFGAGDLIEIEDQAGRRRLVPFRERIAERDGERIIVDREFLA